MRKIVSITIKVGISLGLIIFLLYQCKIEPKQLGVVLKHANLPLLMIATVLAIIVLCLKSLRWHSLVKRYSQFSIWTALKLYMGSFAFGVLTPGRLGEFLKVYQLNTTTRIGVGKSFETVLCDRMFDMFFLVWCGSAGGLYWWVPIFFDCPRASLLVSFVANLALLITTVFCLKRLLLKFPPQWPRLYRVAEVLVKSAVCMLNFHSIVAWLISLVAYSGYFFSDQLILRACGVPVSFCTVAFLFSFIGLILLLPLSIAGLGTREAAMVFLLAGYGFDNSDVLAASLCQFSIYFVGCGIVGMFFLLFCRLRFSGLKAELSKLRKNI